MIVEHVFCPAYGCYVHPDDYTDGINDLENIMREEARDYAQEVADYYEELEWLTAVERHSDYLDSCVPTWTDDGVPF